jgi:Tol biopolymer transport system component
MDRDGTSTPIVDVGRIVDMPRVSHDGGHIAFRAPAPDCEIWVHEVERGVTSRVTREGDSHGIVWLPGDERLAFARVVQPPNWSIVASRADGSGPIESLLDPMVPRGFASSCTPDGQYLLICAETETGSDVYLGNADDKSVRPLLHSDFRESAAVFSPDGHFIAYVSDEDGSEDVYVQPFPALDSRHKISTGGGTDPVWSRDGKELFFVTDRALMVVETASDPNFVAGRARVLVEPAPANTGSSGLACYDVSADGQRFVMVRATSGASGTDMHVVLNWLDELRALAPIEKR